jgi:hypothetical protein
MTLHFPNHSRSFDADNDRILFWGYDNIIEVAFFLKTDALKKFNSENTDTESGFLKIFDTVRNQIYKVADKVYSQVGKGNYACILSAKDF